MRFTWLRRDVERPVGLLHPLLPLALVLVLTLQAGWHHLSSDRRGVQAEPLPLPPSTAILRGMSLGDPELLSRLLMLWLQAFDNQPGISLSYADLDYDRVEAWLAVISELDPRSQYPYLAAIRLYAQINVPEKRRQMYEFVYRAYLQAPARRWRWLAEAAIGAKHKLGDIKLAHRYARALREQGPADQIPGWARQMEIFLLEDLGEQASARVLLGGLLDSGQIEDPAELLFLKQELERLDSTASNAAE